MFIHAIDIETTGTVAIGRIDMLRMHAAEIYVAPAVGEFFDCKRWCIQTESIFFGQWTDVERAHTMLGMIRSTMEREFADFLKTVTGSGEHPKSLAASFSKGMGHRISKRLGLLKAGRTANVLARGKDLAAALAKPFQGAQLKIARWRTPSSSMIAYAAGVEAGDRVELFAADQRVATAAKSLRYRDGRGPLDRRREG